MTKIKMTRVTRGLCRGFADLRIVFQYFRPVHIIQAVAELNQKQNYKCVSLPLFELFGRM